MNELNHLENIWKRMVHDSIRSSSYDESLQDMLCSIHEKNPYTDVLAEVQELTREQLTTLYTLTELGHPFREACYLATKFKGPLELVMQCRAYECQDLLYLLMEFSDEEIEEFTAWYNEVGNTMPTVAVQRMLLEFCWAYYIVRKHNAGKNCIIYKNLRPAQMEFHLPDIIVQNLFQEIDSPIDRGIAESLFNRKWNYLYIYKMLTTTTSNLDVPEQAAELYLTAIHAGVDMDIDASPESVLMQLIEEVGKN